MSYENASVSNVACAPMRDPQKLESTMQALLERHQRNTMAIGCAYDDVAIEIAQYRADRTDATAMNLAIASEHLLCRLDDMRDTDDAEWDAASKAVDPFVV